MTPIIPDAEQFLGGIDYFPTEIKNQHVLTTYVTLLAANAIQSSWVKRVRPQNDDFPVPAPREPDVAPIDWYAAAESSELSDFRTFADQWKADTLYSSSLDEICFHEAYQSIMAMGKEALPWILEELNKQFGHWFYALRYIARKDVAKGAKNLEEARQCWLEWGRKTGKLK